MSPGIILLLGGHSALAEWPSGVQGAAGGVHAAGEFLLKEYLLLLHNTIHLPPQERADLPGAVEMGRKPAWGGPCAQTFVWDR